jgi:hypothetical protein
VLVGCGRAAVHTSPSISLDLVCGPSTPYVSPVGKLSSACIINHHVRSCQTTYQVVKTSCHITQCIIMKEKFYHHIIQITCEQVSSKNKFCKCARAGCYNGCQIHRKILHPLVCCQLVVEPPLGPFLLTPTVPLR